MGSQSLVSKVSGVVLVVVLGLLSTTTVSTATTFTIEWAVSPTYPGGFAVSSAKGELSTADSLLFQYNSSVHDLLSVSKDDFNNCITGNPFKNFTDGNTTIHHETPGTFWYICGTPGHCAKGQKLAVVVVSGPSSSPAPAPGPVPHSAAVALRPYETTSVMVAAVVILGLVSFRKL